MLEAGLEPTDFRTPVDLSLAFVVNDTRLCLPLFIFTRRKIIERGDNDVAKQAYCYLVGVDKP